MRELFQKLRSIEQRLEALGEKGDGFDADADPFALDNAIAGFNQWLNDVDERLKELEDNMVYPEDQYAEKE